MARVTGSLLGDAVIEVVPGDGTEPHVPIPPGGTMRGVVGKDPLAAIAHLETNISVAAESIAQTSDRIGELAARANRILDVNEPQFNRIISNTELAMAQFRTTSEHLDELFGDDQMRQNLKQAVNNLPKVLNDVTESINGVRTVMQSADRNLTNLEGLTRPLGDRGPTLVANLDRAAEQLDDLMGDLTGFIRALTNSQGTLSRLVKDPDLYDDVAETVHNLRELTVKLRPIIDDVRVVTDKAARHPEQFGVRGLIQSNSGIK
jgi:phospholipid/cholesterol/gamma-HCH transport system substrate-binding protein